MANIAIVHTETHDESKPAGSRARSLGDDDIREYKRTVRERLAIDHEFAADESGDNGIGIHKKVTMKVAADPATYDDVGYVYLKTVAGVIELFYKDSSGNVIQLTTAGKINDSVLAKTGDWMLSSVTTARAGWTNVSATYSNKFMRINATPLTTGGADTHTHTVTLSTDNLPAHTHNIPSVSSADLSGGSYTINRSGGGVSQATGSAGSGSAATTSSGDNVPAYVQVVVFQKD